MPQDTVHSVLEGLDSSKSKGGLIIKKKPKPDDDGSDQSSGGFKLPSGPSLLGLDKLAAVKERERKLKEAETAKKRQLEEEAEENKSDKFVRKDDGRERQLREPRVETPSYTGGVSQEALKREEERRRRDDRGLRVEKKRERDSDYYDREWKRDRDRDRDRRDRERDRKDRQNRYTEQLYRTARQNS